MNICRESDTRTALIFNIISSLMITAACNLLVVFLCELVRHSCPSVHSSVQLNVKTPKQLLTDVVGVLLHDVRLQQVVSQHEGPLLHGVQQHGGGPQLLSSAQLPPRCLRLRLQQVVDRLHHRLGESKSSI